MPRSTIVLLVLTCASLVIADVYPPCDDETITGTLNNVVITGCSSTTRCNVQLGTTLPFEVEFTPSRDTSSLTVKMYGRLPGVPIQLPFIGFDTVGCNPNYGIQCPLRAFSLYKYNSTVHVPTAVVTPLNVQAKLQMKDDSGDTIVCFLIDMKIVG